MNKEIFKQEIQKLSMAYDTEVKEGTLVIYWQWFKTIKPEAFIQAVDRCILLEQFFPKIATINRYLNQSLIDSIPTELDVHNDLKRAILKYGRYESPVFKYPITQAIVEAVGWFVMCDSTPDQNNKSVTFKYPAVRDQYKQCLLDGRKFPINRIKGLFETQGERIKLPSGNTAYVSKRSGAESLADNIEKETH